MTRNEGDGSGRTQGNKATRIRAQPVAARGLVDQGVRPFNCCRTSVRAEILLQQYGAYPDWEGDSHYTPLTIAAGNGHLDMVELLLNNRAGPSRYDDVGYKSPLIVAARNGHLDVVDLLLRRGADIDYANIYRKTALMYAAQKGHIKIVKKLLEKGADPRMTDSWGYDAVDYARKPEVRKVIEEHMRDHGQTREKSCLKSILSIIGGWIQWMFDCSSSHRQAPELPGISGGTGPLPEVDQMPSVANQQTVENASMIQTQKSCCPSPYSG